jgi:hypothetical protein
MCTLHIRPSKNTHQVEKYAQPPRHANSLTLQISIIPTSLQSLRRVPSDPASPSGPDRPLSPPSEQKAAEKPAHRTQAFSAFSPHLPAEPENLLNAWSVMHMIVGKLVGRAKKKNHSDDKSDQGTHSSWIFFFPWFSQNTCASPLTFAQQLRALVGNDREREKTCS